MGTASRRFFHGPGWDNWYISLIKNLRLTESKSLEFRGEFFDAFNYAQFAAPQGNFNSSTFGFVTSANAPHREMAVKFIF